MQEKTKYQEELMALYERHGELTPSLVINEAANEATALHGRFEWDDSKAGREYRLMQARALIRSVRVILSKNKNVGATKSVHLFIHVPPEEGGGEGTYHTREVIAKHTDMFGRAFDELQRSLSSAQESVEEMHSLAPKRKRRKISHIGETIGQAQEEAQQLGV